MVDILRRELAPISPDAWGEIDEEARRTLKGNLSARYVTDFSGPHGWELAAVNTGKLNYDKKPVNGVPWGLRESLPLVEIRVPFTLNIMDLDSVSRGSKAPGLDSVHEAARKAAMFEENAVYYGFDGGGITGLAKGSPLKAPAISKGSAGLQEAVEAGVVAIEKQGIKGPYDLVLGDAPYQALMTGDERGYPLHKRISDVIGGKTIWSPVVKGGVLVSKRGGDSELTIGQDYSIGYESHDKGNVTLYITLSFTFQVFEPSAAVEFKLK